MITLFRCLLFGVMIINALNALGQWGGIPARNLYRPVPDKEELLKHIKEVSKDTNLYNWVAFNEINGGRGMMLSEINGSCNVLLSLSDPYILYSDTVSQTDSIYNTFPYTLAMEDFNRPFTQELFKRFKSGQLPMFRDKDLKIPYAYSDYHKETFFLDYFLSKKYRKGKKQPANAEVLPDYRMDLYLCETWEYNSGITAYLVRGGEFNGSMTDYFKVDTIQRMLRAGAIFLTDINKPNIARNEMYFDLNHPAVPYHLLRVRCDYNGDPNANVKELIFNKKLNFKLHSCEGELPKPMRLGRYITHYGFYSSIPSDTVGEAPADAPVLTWEGRIYNPETQTGREVGTERINYRMLVPPMLYPTSKDEKPVSYEALAGSKAIFQQAVPLLFRNVLRGKVKLYSIYEFDKVIPMKAKDFFHYIDRHPLTPEPVNKKNIKVFDFSYGIQDLEVSGTLIRDTLDGYDGSIKFKLDYIGLVWGNNWDDDNKTIITRIRAKDLKGYKVNNRPLVEFLEKEIYYYTMIRVGDSHPFDMTEANYIDWHLRRSIMWKYLPHQLHYRMLPEAERRAMNEQRGLIRK